MSAPAIPIEYGALPIARRAAFQAAGHALPCCWCGRAVEPSQPPGAFGCAACTLEVAA